MLKIFLSVIMFASTSFAENSCVPKEERIAKQSISINDDGSVTISNPFVMYKGKKYSLTRVEYNGYFVTKAGEELVCKFFGFSAMTDIELQKVSKDSVQRSTLVIIDDYINETTPKSLHINDIAAELKNDKITSITCIK